MNKHFLLGLCTYLMVACSPSPSASTTNDKPPEAFPYGNIPREKPDMPLSAAMERVYEGTYTGLETLPTSSFSRLNTPHWRGLIIMTMMERCLAAMPRNH